MAAGHGELPSWVAERAASGRPFMPVPDAVAQLIAKFDRQADEYRSGRFNETQTRVELIDKLFAALGWNVHNDPPVAESYKDVIHGDAIKVGGVSKAPDYCFRVGRERKFFVEAKRPGIDLGRDAEAALQLRRYGRSAKLPLSILTNFAQTAVYDCRVRTSPRDKPATARVVFLGYRELPDRWDDFAAIFSREAAWSGAFDRYAESQRKRGTAEFDEDFLAQIEGWRLALARNLALRNPTLGAVELNYAVQQTIDRVVFLRICEDRGIEQYGRLQVLLNGPHTYARLFELFRDADTKYDSGLFHFRREAARPEPDRLTPGLQVDDGVLKAMLRELYHPHSEYEFAVVPAEILGEVYERFLGRVIRLTESHHAKVEEKSEVRKAGGVYYTRAYLAEYVAGHVIEQILAKRSPRTAADLRILDPACGSGTFLLVAYQQLLDWYAGWYVAHGPQRYGRGPRPCLYRSPAGDWRLTTDERKRILLAHVFGVDLDPQAVEVTRLALLLKVLEGETEESLSRGLFRFRDRALPDLDRNIVCGNSLLRRDFQAAEGAATTGDPLARRPFDWEAVFPEVFRGSKPGFSAIVGNPPWGAVLSEAEREYLRREHARVVGRMVDSYLYFTDEALRRVRVGAPIGLVLPSTLLNQEDAQPLRELLLDAGVDVVLSLGQGLFGSRTLNTSTVLITSGPRKARRVVAGDLTRVPRPELRQAIRAAPSVPRQEWEDVVRADPHRTFFVGDLVRPRLLHALRARHRPLSDFLAGAIERGVTPDVAAMHVLTPQEASAHDLEKTLLRRSVSGKQIRRYEPWRADRVLAYATRDLDPGQIPGYLAFAQPFRNKVTCKEVARGAHPWWALHRGRDPAIFVSPKFVGLTTTHGVHLIYDHRDDLVVTDAMYVFRLRKDQDPMAALAILHSRLFLGLYQVANQGDARVIPQIKAAKLGALPYPGADKGTARAEKLAERCGRLLDLHEGRAAARAPHAREAFSREIGAVDAEVETLVRDAYGLSRSAAAALEGRQP
ncbi:MAG: restriction endonuclease subunit M [Deltaproteobacteria bacterium]|nr:restriction endonuclease subunit M [Deltaproteobacteria bacterium]